MLIDCDTCTARGTGCADCVVTVLLGAPPGWHSADPAVVPMTARPRLSGAGGPVPVAATGGLRAPAPVPHDDALDDALDDAHDDAVAAEDVVVPPPGVVVEFDEVERRAVRALAAVGLVPPLRHRSRSDDHPDGAARTGRRTG